MDYAEALELEIRQIGEKPIVMGHSMGGLLAQILGARGLAKSLVLLTHASPSGLMALKPSVIKSFWSVMTTWGFWRKPLRQTFRGGLAKTLAEAAEYIVERVVAQETAPPLIRFIAQIAARFGVPVSEKAMAQSLPIVGAAGGALINTLFIDHFQDVGRGHFIVRRLERTYDPELVRREYLKLPPR